MLEYPSSRPGSAPSLASCYFVPWKAGRDDTQREVPATPTGDLELQVDTVLL